MREKEEAKAGLDSKADRKRATQSTFDKSPNESFESEDPKQGLPEENEGNSTSPWVIHLENGRGDDNGGDDGDDGDDDDDDDDEIEGVVDDSDDSFQPSQPSQPTMHHLEHQTLHLEELEHL